MTENEIDRIADRVIDRLGADLPDRIYDGFERKMSISLGRGIWKLFLNSFLSACLVLIAYGATQGWFKQ